MTDRPNYCPSMTEIQGMRLRKLLAEASALARELQDGGLTLRFERYHRLDDVEMVLEVRAHVSVTTFVTVRGSELA